MTLLRMVSITGAIWACSAPARAQAPQEYGGSQVTVVSVDRMARYAREGFSLAPRDANSELVVVRISVVLGPGSEGFGLKPGDVRLVDVQGKKHDAKRVSFTGSMGSATSWGSTVLEYGPTIKGSKAQVWYFDAAAKRLITLDSTELPAPLFFAVPKGAELTSLMMGRVVFDLSGFPAAKGM